jgi:hypothetical protein
VLFVGREGAEGGGAYGGSASTPVSALVLTEARLRHVTSSQVGKAALSLDGRAAQPSQAGGSSLIFISMASNSRIKVRKNRCTTEGPERKFSSFAAVRTRRLPWSVNLRSGPRDYHIYIAGRSIRP